MILLYICKYFFYVAVRGSRRLSVVSAVGGIFTLRETPERLYRLQNVTGASVGISGE